MGPVRRASVPRSVSPSSAVPVRSDSPIRSDSAARSRDLRLVERALAATLLVISAPILLLVGLIVLLVDGRPVIYSGSRLGRNRRPFTIYKLRTLRRGAQKLVGGRMVTESDGLTIPFGRALRACRLDELPQLINIIRGDMNFWGPRPERPEVYREQCLELHGYDRRFRVAPGLVGISQLFTPHKTAKRFRTRLDNGMLEAPPGTARQARIIAYTALCTLRTLGTSAAEWLREDLIEGKLLRRHARQRTLKRVRPRSATLRIDPSPGIGGAAELESVADIVDLNEKYFRARSTRNLSTESTRDVRLRIPVRRNGRIRHRNARCIVSLKDARLSKDSCEYVFQYEPRDSYSEYVVEQYFLKNSLATPARFVGRRLK